MSYLDTTFERSGNLIKTFAKVSGGWESTKKSGCQFYAQQLVDYRGDITLSVKVWISSAFAVDYTGLERANEYIGDFPFDFRAHFNDEKIRAAIADGCLSISVYLRQELPWIVTSNRKPAIDWGPQIIAQYHSTAYLLRHMIVFNLPSSKRGDYKEWDLLPFLPGGLVERNRRRH